MELRPGEQGGGERIKIVIIDISDSIESKAMDIAERKLTINPEEYKGIFGFVRRGIRNFLKGNLLRDFYRDRYYRQALETIREKGYYAVDEGVTEKERDEAIQATIDRFSSEFDETVHKEAGEVKEIIDKGGEDLKKEIKELIAEYVRGQIDRRNFEERKNRIVTTIAQRYPDIFKGRGYVDNLLFIAEQIKNSGNHEQGLSNLDLGFDLILGKARIDPRTEAKFGKISRLIDKINRTKIGSLIGNETVIASAISLAYSVSKGIAQRLATSRIAALATFGGTALVAGAFAGAREAHALERERTLHAREMALGRAISPELKRRVEIEQARYQTEQASKYIKELENWLDVEIKNFEQFTQAASILAELEARILISDAKRIDLLSYSSEVDVEKQRRDLDILRAQLKIKLRKLSDQYKFPNDKKFDEYYSGLVHSHESRFTQEELEKKDAIWRKMRRKRVAQAFMRGSATGILVGVTVQEIVAMFSPRLQGAFESIFKETQIGKKSLAFLEYLREKIAGSEALPTTPAGFHLQQLLGGNFKLPTGYDLIENPDGSFSLIHNSDTVATGLRIENGSFSAESLSKLSEAGFHFETDNLPVTENVSTTEVYSSKDFVEQNENLFTKVKRVLWYNNNTDKPDLNELRLTFGGKGVDEAGNVVLSIEKMVPGGSFHDELSANVWKLVEEGKLKLLISLSNETQSHVLQFDITPDGGVIIPKDHPLFSKLFEIQPGKPPKFLGRFMEVAEVSGVDSEGVEKVRVIATAVGEGLKEIQQQVQQQVIKNIPQITLLPPPPEILVPPVIPIYSRRPLEQLKKIPRPGPTPEQPPTPRPKPTAEPTVYEQEDIPYEFIYEGYDEIPPSTEPSSEDLEKIIKEGIVKMQEYVDKLPSDEKALIENLNKQIGEDMSNECRLSVVIPAYKEAGNIYRTLEGWLVKQKNIKPEELEIIVFVNSPSPEEPDEETIKEVRRFQQENPQYKVRLVTHQFDFKDGRPIMGEIYKVAADLALYRNLQRLKVGVSQEIVASHLMRAGGADAVDRDPEFVRKTIDYFSKHPRVEQLKTGVRYPIEVLRRFPLFHAIDTLRRGVNLFFTRGRSNLGLGTFRARVYAEAGGFNRKKRIAEEVDLARRIREIIVKRGGEGLKTLAVKREVDNPRRQLFALLKKIGMLNAYSKFGDAKLEEELRNFDWAKAEDTDYSRLTKENFTREAQAYLDYYFGLMTRRLQREKGYTAEEATSIAIDETRKLFRRVMGLGLGLRYGIDYEIKQEDSTLRLVVNDSAIDTLQRLATVKWELMAIRALRLKPGEDYEIEYDEKTNLISRIKFLNDEAARKVQDYIENQLSYWPAD